MTNNKNKKKQTKKKAISKGVQTKKKQIKTETPKEKQTKTEKIKEVEKQKIEIPNSLPESNSTEKQAKYYSFNKRLLISSIALIILLLLMAFFLKSLIKYDNGETVQYTENGKIKYYVTLKNNDFYEQNQLSGDMLYIASLIDEIKVDFNYNLDLEQKLDLDLDYDVIGKLVIKNAAGDKVYFEKDYNLDSSDAKVEDKKYNYSKNINIDYNYYNHLASSFKTKYGVDATSYLRVIFNIKKKSTNFELEDRNMYVEIPLSERDVNITLKPMELKNSSKVVKEKSITLENAPFNIFCLLVLLGLTIYDSIILIKLINSLVKKSSPYTKVLRKILREYDRLIVETRIPPDFEGKNIIKLYEFKELLDVRDNLKLPVMFCEIIKGQKSQFYISHDKDIFVYTLKSVDLEKK